MSGVLTNKQERFCDEYLVDLNATQAAIRAGYSKKTANQQGPRLLVNVGIQERIQELMDKRSERTQITQETVLKNLEELRDLAKKDKQFSPSVRAVELLGKHLGMFGEKQDHGGEVIIYHIEKPNKPDNSGM